MINVYHIVYNKFFRVHFPFKDNKYIKNILVIDGQIKLDFVETGYKLVKHENVHFTEFKHTHILIPFLNNLFRKNPPHIAIASKFLEIPIRDHILSKGCKILYINHGLLTKLGGTARLTAWDNEYARKYARYFCTKSEIEYFEGAKMPKQNIVGLGGSPQLDYLFSLDMNQQKAEFMKHVSASTGKLVNNCQDPINPNRKVVLLIENNGGIVQVYPNETKTGGTGREYCTMMQQMIREI
jgi:hypothetical protein